MSYLLDTHTFLWYVNGDDRLSSRAIEAIETPGSEIFLSIASLWEIAVKVNIGKLEIEGDISGLMLDMESLAISLLPISVADLNTYLELPLHHRDPFDRLLIAQAGKKGLTVIGTDQQFDAYAGIQRLW